MKKTEVKKGLADKSAADLQIELNGVISSIAHLAYHFGAIRQIDRATRGPAAA